MTAIVFASVFGLAVILAASNRAAYRNGVTDGYGYSREPLNPGYAAAGRYLRRYERHRWPDLQEPVRGKYPDLPTGLWG